MSNQKVQPARTRRRRKDDRPGEILEAARSAFMEKGFELAKVEEIARRAGVSKGTVYLYYPTKEELFAAVVKADFLPVIERMRGALDSDSSSSAATRMRLIGETMYGEIAGSDRRLLTHLVIAEGRRFPWLADFYFREIMQPGLELVTRVLEEGQTSGEFDPDGLGRHPEILVSPIIVAALFAILFSKDGQSDIASYREAHLDLVLRGLTRSAKRGRPPG